MLGFNLKKKTKNLENSFFCFKQDLGFNSTNVGLLEGAFSHRRQLGVEWVASLYHMIAQYGIFLHLTHLVFTTFSFLLLFCHARY